jgi:hypothetical protein
MHVADDRDVGAHRVCRPLGFRPSVSTSKAVVNRLAL